MARSEISSIMKTMEATKARGDFCTQSVIRSMLRGALCSAYLPFSKIRTAPRFGNIRKCSCTNGRETLSMDSAPLGFRRNPPPPGLWTGMDRQATPGMV